jgi:hypothetical protein
MDAKLEAVIRFLNEKKVRATYGAVADYLGVRPISMGRRLGDRHVAASWIVNGNTGRPTGYAEGEIHPDVLTSTELIRSGADLATRMNEA